MLQSLAEEFPATLRQLIVVRSPTREITSGFYCLNLIVSRTLNRLYERR